MIQITLPLIRIRMLVFLPSFFLILILKLIYSILLCSSREQSATLSCSLNALEKSQGDLENKLGSMQNQHQQDASRLKVELTQAENRTKSLQKEVPSACCLFAANCQVRLQLLRTHTVSVSLCSMRTLRASCQTCGRGMSRRSRRSAPLMTSWSSARSI